MIAVAISGGVDSAFSAWLLSRTHEVLLIHALFVPDPKPDTSRVQEIARFLKLPLKVVDLREAFSKKVISYFKEAYLRGLTPNPCVVCNKLVKFGLLLEEAKRLGARKLATGHYARVKFDSALGRYLLFKGRDPGKDQSYFLHQLSQDALSSVVFPLGDYLKEEVIKEAVSLGLFNLTAPESQEVCFIKGDYRELFKESEFLPGEIVTTDGRVVGRHRGLFAYTVGQRRGLGLRLGKPYYVVRIDAKRNRVVVGTQKELYRKTLRVSKVNFVYPVDAKRPFRALVKIRYRHKEAPATVVPLGSGIFEVIFDRPQKAITPGQFAVFYEGDMVLGGGEIQPEEDLDG